MTKQPNQPAGRGKKAKAESKGAPALPTVQLSDTLPKWLQVVSALKVDIERRAREGKLRLPTEALLAKQYDVSVVTIRQALTTLELRGMITRQRKLGTMIRKEGLSERATFNLGTITNVFKQQKSDWIELVSADITSVPDALKDFYPNQKNVMKFVRRRFTGKTLGNYATNYMRLDVAAQVDLELIRSLPITQIVHQHTKFKVARVEQHLVADVADPVMAANLGIEPLSPTLVLNGYTYDKQGQILDVANVVYRGDSFTFVLHFDVR